MGDAEAELNSQVIKLLLIVVVVCQLLLALALMKRTRPHYPLLMLKLSPSNPKTPPDSVHSHATYIISQMALIFTLKYMVIWFLLYDHLLFFAQRALDISSCIFLFCSISFIIKLLPFS